MEYYGYGDDPCYDFDEIYEPCFNEGLAEGKRVHYDACSSGTLEEGRRFYGDRYEYIGSGFKTWHNGVENNWKEEHHFFIIKQNQ